MRKTFVLFQLYIQFFVFSHYCYVIFRFYSSKNSEFDKWVKFIGIGTDYDATGKYFAFNPDIPQWVLIFLTFLQMRVYLNRRDD